jgi:C4-dicarboxylate-specific signal transduction histidine kinase
MRVLNNISIKRKLMVLIMLAVAAAMILSCTAFVINDVRLIRKDLIRQLSALAELLGSNSTAALTFDDSATATQLLDSLRKQPIVTSAVIYDANGAIFASYPEVPNASLVFEPIPGIGYQSTKGHLDVTSAIVQNEERIGTIRIRGDSGVIRQEIAHYAMIVAIVLAVSFAAAYLLASRLQHVISRPILALAQVAQTVSHENDYSIRVEKLGNDELGILCDEFNHMLEQIGAGKQALEEAHGKLELRVQKRTEQLSKTNEELSNEIAERRRAELELERAHRELVDAARRAGMAEIATGVLHNVGNVLNSVNVSAGMLASRLRSSKRSHLNRIVALLKEHDQDLGDFLTSDEKGKQIPAFLAALAEHLQADEQAMLDESQSLTNNVEHIRTIISTQQSYAGVSGIVEPVDVNTLLDDAVRLYSAAFDRHQIRLERNYAKLPTVLTDKQRVLQIVVNLVKNAKESLIELKEGERVMTLRTRAEGKRLIIEVGDTGVGIEKENLTRIFSHGFTTKASGHGFGLHSCANAATEMDGALSAQSEGPSKGALFVLDLPLTPAAVLT